MSRLRRWWQGMTDGEAMTRLWLRIWWWSRKRAVAAYAAKRPEQYQDALRAWETRPWDEDPNTWCTRGMPNDLALHDAADSLLGRNA